MYKLETKQLLVGTQAERIANKDFIDNASLFYETDFGHYYLKLNGVWNRFTVPGSVVWRGAWIDGTTYYAGDMVTDEGWLMIANKATAQKPAPQRENSNTWLFSDTPSWIDLTSSVSKLSGNRFTLNQGGWVESLRVWIPEIASGSDYRFVAAINGIISEAQPIFNPVVGWNFVLPRRTIMPSGFTIDGYIEAVNLSDSTTLTFQWIYEGTSQNANPSSGNWNRNNQSTILRIHTLDVGATDRTANLDAIGLGQYFRISEATNPNNFVEYTILNNNGLSVDTYTYDVSILDSNGTIPPSTICNIDFITPGVALANYSTITNYWNTNQPSWATVEGVENLISNPLISNDGFGVDVLFQPADFSTDWDIASHSDI